MVLNGSTEGRPRDKYDEAIEYYTKNPDKIYEEWPAGMPNSRSCLFATLPTTYRRYWAGCPTQCHPKYKDENYNYRADLHPVVLARLDELIALGVIPPDPKDIRPEYLPYYAELQRLSDGLFTAKS